MKRSLQLWTSDKLQVQGMSFISTNGKIGSENDTESNELASNKPNIGSDEIKIIEFTHLPDQPRTKGEGQGSREFQGQTQIGGEGETKHEIFYD